MAKVKVRGPSSVDQMMQCLCGTCTACLADMYGSAAVDRWIAASPNKWGNGPYKCVTSRDVDMINLLLGDQDTIELTNAFAPVAQPDYFWTEKHVSEVTGKTAIPTPPTNCDATITFPVGNTPLARMIRLHELLHARFTPPIARALEYDSGLKKRLEKVSPEALQCAEDVRLAALARARGVFGDPDVFFPMKALLDAAEDRDGKGAQKSDVKTAALFIATFGLPMEGGWDSRSLREFFDRSQRGANWRTKRALKKWIKEVDGITGKTWDDPVAQFEALAQATHKVFTKAAAGRSKSGNLLSQGNNGKKDGGLPKSDAGRASDEAVRQEARRRTAADELRGLSKQASPILGDLLRSQAIANAINEAMAEAEKKRRHNTKAPFGDGGDGPDDGRRGYGSSEKAIPWKDWGLRPPPPDREAARDFVPAARARCWGTMEIQLAPLLRNFRALVKRNGVAAPDGALPKHFGRWFGDKQLFERQGLRRGGTLLIDVSGSMSWAWEITKKLIETTPSMTIAIYSAKSSTEEEGILTIIAKDGKLTSADFSPRVAGHGGGNTVDGPALEWLAKQPRPRVWFSDGSVCSPLCRDIADAEALRVDAARICRLGAIKRTVDPEEVKKIFAGRRVASDVAS